MHAETFGHESLIIFLQKSVSNLVYHDMLRELICSRTPLQMVFYDYKRESRV